MITVYPVVPISAPRQVHRDLFYPSPHVLRYRAYQDELRLRGLTVPAPFHHFIFVLPVFASWSKKKQVGLEGMPHQQKPDRDNLEKAVLDSACSEDCYVWDGRTTKLWGQRGLLLVAAYPVPVALPFDLSPYYAAATLTDESKAPCARVAAREHI